MLQLVTSALWQSHEYHILLQCNPGMVLRYVVSAHLEVWLQKNNNNISRHELHTVSAHLEVWIPSWASANLGRSPAGWQPNHLCSELPNSIEHLLLKCLEMVSIDLLKVLCATLNLWL